MTWGNIEGLGQLGKKKRCPKCESRHWMTGLHMEFPTETRVCVLPPNNSRAVGASNVRVEACGACGYVEYYLTNPYGVLEEWRKQNA